MSKTTPVILSKQKHAKLTYKALQDYSFTAGCNVVALLVAEVVPAARCFPIVFSNPKNAIPHAMLGLGSENIFLNKKGGWTAPYLPLVFGNYPFSLADVRFSEEEKKHEIALAIQEDAPHFHKKGGLPLYTPEGKATETLQRIVGAMAKQYHSHQISEKALHELYDSDVLVERIVSLRHQGKDRTVGGLRVADREKVMALPEETLARWTKIGLMEMLFAHWQSMRHIEVLLKHPSCPVKNETVH